MKRKAADKGDNGQRSIASYFSVLPKQPTDHACVSKAAAGQPGREPTCAADSGPAPSRAGAEHAAAQRGEQRQREQKEQQQPNVSPEQQPQAQVEVCSPASTQTLGAAAATGSPTAAAAGGASCRQLEAAITAVEDDEEQHREEAGTSEPAVPASREEQQGGGENEYERQRAERIRRNQEVMAAMGLGVKPSASPSKRPAKRAAPRRPKPPAPSSGPVRRSARVASGAGGRDESGQKAIAAPAVQQAAAQPEPEPLSFDDSSVAHYICDVLRSGAGGAGSAAVPADTDQVAGFVQLPGCLSDAGLPQAYSLAYRPGLVLAGGKGGVVSIWGSRQLEAGQLVDEEGEGQLAPLISYKLHRGWVSDVAWLSSAPGDLATSSAGGDASSSSSSSSVLFLSASNDGALCLWDASRAAREGRGMRPQCLAQADDLHSGGIFSMAEAGGRVATASKDCTVALSSVLPSGGLALQQRFDALHGHVIKCVRWAPHSGAGGAGGSSVFGSCGNDGRICVVDSRQDPGAAASLVIEGAHSSVVNCLRWHPTDAHLLLTTSHDAAILVHDLRSPAQPLFCLSGHTPLPRVSSIYQPAWVAGGDAIATGGERSPLLSLYCAKTGATISRGAVPINIHATACEGGGRGAPLLCSTTKAVYFFSPSWKPATQA